MPQASEPDRNARPRVARIRRFEPRTPRPGAPKPSLLPRIPHFSLLTLVLAVLLVAAALGLWRCWSPWALAYTLKHPGDVNHAQFSPDGQCIWTRSQSKGHDMRIAVWNARTGASVLQEDVDQYLGFGSKENGLCSPAGTWTYYKGGDMIDRPYWVWNLRTGKEAQWITENGKGLANIAFSDDDRYALCVEGIFPAGYAKPTEPNQIVTGLFVIDTRTGKRRCTFKNTPSTIIEMSLSPDARWALTVGKSATTHRDETQIWNAETGELLKDTRLFNYGRFSPDSKYLLRKVLHQENIDIVELPSFDTKRTVQGTIQLRGGTPFSPDGTRALLQTADDGKSQTWQAVSLPGGESLFTMKSEKIYDLSWGPAGQSIYADTGMGNRVVLDAADGRERYRLRGWLAVARDESRFALYDHASVWVGVPASGERLFTFPVTANQLYFGLDIAPDGRQVVLMTGSEVQVWELRRGENAFGLLLRLEFWLTFIFLIALAWSLRRDFKTLRKAKAA